LRGLRGDERPVLKPRPLGPVGAAQPPGKPLGHATAARWTERNPALPPDAVRRQSSRRRTSPCAGRAAPAPPPRPGSPPADRTGQLPGQRRPLGPGRRDRHPGMVILGPVRDLPRHGRTRAARLLPALALLRPLCGTALLPGRPPPWKFDTHTCSRSLTHLTANLGNDLTARYDHAAQPGTEPAFNPFASKALALGADSPPTARLTTDEPVSIRRSMQPDKLAWPCLGPRRGHRVLDAEGGMIRVGPGSRPADYHQS
jgi:hypothetical protein